MKTSSSIEAIRHQVKAWRAAGETVAFVPTMGNLHAGHLSLVTEGLKQADHVVASVYVNPMQFAAHEDLDTYPRTLDADLAALEQAGAELVFTPTTETIYPKGLEQQAKVVVPEEVIGDCGESQSRPGFFVGVATVVMKLFNIVQPDVAIFGRKDYQQLLVIKTMVEDFAMPIKIIGVDTYRENNGLAMSSRNNYLTAEQKEQAAVIKRAMDTVATELKNGSKHDTAIQQATSMIAGAGLKPDYILVRNANTLEAATNKDSELVIKVAAFLGNTRLIDNQRVDLR